MDTYLSKRKKPVKKKPKKKKKTEEEEEFKEEEEIEYYKKEKNMIDKFLDFLLGEETVDEPEVKEIDEIEEEIEEEIKEDKEFEEELEEMEEKPKLGFFDRLKRLLLYNKSREELIYEEIESEEFEEQINQEIKEALKIQNKWLSRLSAKEIKKFKKSRDYKRYVEILKKFDLIKKE